MLTTLCVLFVVDDQSDKCLLSVIQVDKLVNDGKGYGHAYAYAMNTSVTSLVLCADDTLS